LISIAYALGAGGAGGGGGGSPFTSFLPLIIMFAIFYFLLIRPQQKKNKAMREMIAALKKGDRIVTGGGIHGRITGVSENVITVEIADKVRVKVNRANVAALNMPQTPAPAAKGGKSGASK
jgi:preprotein translocase subunit YajC